MDPWLHVLVPAYGPSPYLRETLESVRRASRERVRLTVIDDGSPGPEIADTCQDFPEWEYVALGANRGVAGAFQEAVGRSTGTYTVILGSDDLVEPWFFQELTDLVTRFDEPAMATTQVLVVGSDGSPVRPLPDRVKALLSPRSAHPVLLRGDRLTASLLTGNWLYFPAIAWRTDCLRETPFRLDMHTAMDLDVELRLAFAGHGLAWSPRPSFRYRRHSGSASSVTAASGVRFDEERELFARAAADASRLGWTRSRLAARVHATSRLHHGAATLRRVLSRGSGRST